MNSNILYSYRSLIFDKRARQFPVEGLAVLGFCSIELTVRTFVSEGEFLFPGIQKKRRGTYAQFLGSIDNTCFYFTHYAEWHCLLSFMKSAQICFGFVTLKIILVMHKSTS